MLTLCMWRDYDFKLNYFYYCRTSKYSNEEMAMLLILAICLTPLTLVLDILLIPLELFYLLCLKIVEKKRRPY